MNILLVGESFNKNVFNVFFIFGTLIATIHNVLGPHLSPIKNSITFPAFSLGPFVFTFMEVFVGIGVFLFLFLHFYNRIAGSKRGFGFNFAPRKFINFLFLVFWGNLLLSACLGMWLGNPEAMFHAFLYFYLLTYHVFYIFKRNVFAFRILIFNLTNFLGIFFSFLILLRLFFPSISAPSFLSNMVYFETMWFGMFFVVFAANYHLNKIIFDSFSLKSVFVFILCLSSIIIRISNKPIFFSMFVSFFVTFLVGILIKRKQSWRFLFVLFLLLSFCYSLFAFSSLKGELFSIFAARFYKIRISPENLEKVSIWELLSFYKDVKFEGGSDASGGRISLWRNYIALSMRHPLVSPNFGKTPVFASSGNKIAPHNIVIRFLYYGGLISGVALALLMIIFIYEGCRFVLKVKILCPQLKLSQLAAIYSFTVGVFSVEMVGGPIVRNINFTWFFFGFLVIFIHDYTESVGNLNWKKREARSALGKKNENYSIGYMS
jgi:hypothetical protein